MNKKFKWCVAGAALFSAQAAFAVCEYDDHIKVCASRSGWKATGTLYPERKISNAQVKLWECREGEKTGCYLAKASVVKTLDKDDPKLLTPHHQMVSGYCYYATAYENGRKIVWTRDDLGKVCR